MADDQANNRRPVVLGGSWSSDWGHTPELERQPDGTLRLLDAWGKGPAVKIADILSRPYQPHVSPVNVIGGTPEERSAYLQDGSTGAESARVLMSYGVAVQTGNMTVSDSSNVTVVKPDNAILLSLCNRALEQFEAAPQAMLTMICGVFNVDMQEAATMSQDIQQHLREAKAQGVPMVALMSHVLTFLAAIAESSGPKPTEVAAPQTLAPIPALVPRHQKKRRTLRPLTHEEEL